MRNSPLRLWRYVTSNRPNRCLLCLVYSIVTVTVCKKNGPECMMDVCRRLFRERIELIDRFSLDPPIRSGVNILTQVKCIPQTVQENVGAYTGVTV